MFARASNTLTSRSTAMDEREDKRIAKRLKAIATAARLSPLGTAAGHSASGDEAGAAGTATAPFAGKVLDIGCGDGTLMPHLVDRAETSKPKKGKGGKKRNAEGSQQARPETPRSGGCCLEAQGARNDPRTGGGGKGRGGGGEGGSFCGKNETLSIGVLVAVAKTVEHALS